MNPAPPFAPAAITAAILAGGRGSRVGGADKGLLPLAGKPLVAHVCQRLRRQASRIVICANRNAAAYAVYAPVLADRVAGHAGPLAGIAAALAACETPWLLTVPVDAPAAPADLAERLWAAALHAQPAAAVACHDAQREPLFALYARGLADSASAALDGDASVWRWQDGCRAVEVDFSDQGAAFANLNSPEDFRRWEERAHA